MDRFGTPEEVARGVLYLLSDAAGFTTGVALHRWRPSCLIRHASPARFAIVTGAARGIGEASPRASPPTAPCVLVDLIGEVEGTAARSARPPWSWRHRSTPGRRSPLRR